MPSLSDSHRQLLDRDALRPIHMVDDETHLEYYVISTAFFEQIRPLIPDERFESHELAPLVAKTAAAAGWDDPAMDIYNHYDAHARF